MRGNARFMFQRDGGGAPSADPETTAELEHQYTAEEESREDEIAAILGEEATDDGSTSDDDSTRTAQGQEGEEGASQTGDARTPKSSGGERPAAGTSAEEDAKILEALSRVETINGAQRTVRDLLLDGTILNALQSHRQLPAVHRALDEVTRGLTGKRDGQDPRGGGEAEAGPQEGVIDLVRDPTPERYQRLFGPVAEMLKEQGYFGEDNYLMQEFPAVANDIVFAKAVFWPMFCTVVESALRLEALSKTVGDVHGKIVDAEVDPVFERTLEAVAGLGGPFELAATPEGRQALMAFIYAQGGASIQQLGDADWLTRQFVAANADKLVGVFKDGKDARRKSKESATRAAAGEGARSGGAPVTGARRTGEAGVIDDVLAQRE